MATNAWETGLLPEGAEGWVSKVTLPDGSEYYIRDDAARTKIQEILNDLTSGVNYIGKSVTALTDQDTTATIKMTDGSSVTLTAEDNGSLVVIDKNAYGTFEVTSSQPTDWTTNWKNYYTKSGDIYVPVTGDTAPTWEASTYYASKGDGAKQDKEFLWNGTSWDEFGSVGVLKSLAYMDPSDIQTASEVVTESGSYTAETTSSTGALEVVESVTLQGTVVTDASVDVTGTITAPSITQGTVTPTKKYAHDVTVVTDTSVDVTGTITAPSITQGAVTPTKKYAHDVTVVTDTSVDVTGTITAPSITQGTNNSTTKYLHQDAAVNGIDNAVKLGVSGETLSFATASPTFTRSYDRYESSEYVVTTAEPADWATNYTSYFTKSGDTYTAVTGATAPTWAASTYYSKGVKVVDEVSIADPTMNDITIAAGTLTDTLTTGTASVVNTTESGSTQLLSDVSVGDPTMNDITIASGTLTDTLTTGTASVVNTTESGGTQLLSDVSVGDPTMNDIVISAGTLTDTLDTGSQSKTTKYLTKGSDTKSKVGIEEKPVTP